MKSCLPLFSGIGLATYVAMVKFFSDESPKPPIAKKWLLASGLIGLGAGFLVGLAINLASYHFQKNECLGE